MADDAQLLSEYVERRSETAFAELVQRHLGLVYHAAVRQLGSESHLAEDAAQRVFVMLAERAPKLRTHPNLVAWLHATTHFKVSETLRAERRRRLRETSAHAVHELMQTDLSAHDWERLRPLIDDVLLELKESDREAVLLRFFEGQPFAEIGARLRLSEATAHKRVERALENLRTRLGRRGVASTAAALATMLGSQAALAAPPAGLAMAITGAALASGLPATAATWSIVTFMSTKATATAVALALVIAGGIATQQLSAQREARSALAAVEQENSALAAQLRAEEARRARLATAPTVNSAPRGSNVAAIARPLGTGGLASVEESQAFLDANPELRAALAAAVRGMYREQFSALIAQLGLTDAERDRFIDIFAFSSRRIVGEHQFTLGEAMPSGTEVGRQLRELLGEARYQQYREFRDNTTPRDFTREMTRALYFTPTPLTAPQAVLLEQMVSRIASDPSLGPKYTGALYYLPQPRWDLLLAEAGSVLAEPQLEALRELQQQSRFMLAQSAAGRAWHAKHPDPAK